MQQNVSRPIPRIIFYFVPHLPVTTTAGSRLYLQSRILVIHNFIKYNRSVCTTSKIEIIHHTARRQTSTDKARASRLASDVFDESSGTASDLI